MNLEFYISQIINSEYSDKISAIHSIKKMKSQNQKLIYDNVELFQNLFDSLLEQRPIPWFIIFCCTDTLLGVPYASNNFNTEKYLCFIIDLSYKITLNFLKYSKPTDKLPDMRPFSVYVTKNVLLSIDIIKKVANHCTLGFLNKSSFLPAFFSKFEDICNIIANSDKDDFEIFLKPITNPDKQIQFFFLAIWVKVIDKLYSSFYAIQQLQLFTQYLITLSDDPFTQIPAQYLLQYTKSSPSDIEDLLKYGKKLIPQLLASITTQIKQKEPVQQTSVTQTKQPTSVIQRAKAQIFIKKAFSSIWDPICVTLIVEARVLMWGKTETQMKYGEAIGFSEITDVELTDTQKKGNKNVLIIHAKKDYSIAFESQNIASQWANVLQSQKVKM